MCNRPAVDESIRFGSGLIMRLIMILTAAPTIADSATMFEFPDGRTAMPVQTVEVRIDAESVSIVPNGELLHWDELPMMDVTCTFYLTNLTERTLDITVGFPFESFNGRSGEISTRDYSNWENSRIAGEWLVPCSGVDGRLPGSES